MCFFPATVNECRCDMVLRRTRCGPFRYGVSVHEKGMDDETDNVGYVHRFPDLLKRWDDVDGDRGTW